MPALPDAPGVLRTAISGQIQAGGVWLTRFYMHYSGTAPSNANLSTWDTDVATFINTNLKSLMTAYVSITQIETIDLTSPTSAVDIQAESITGTRTGDPVPAGACLVSSYEILRRYRGGHPRGYWPFGGEADQLHPTAWSPTFLTAVGTGFSGFFSGLVGSGWTGAGTITHVNVSYYDGFTVVTNPITGRARNVPTLRVSPVIDTVTAVEPRASIGSQRRRMAFVD